MLSVRRAQNDNNCQLAEGEVSQRAGGGEGAGWPRDRGESGKVWIGVAQALGAGPAASREEAQGAGRDPHLEGARADALAV